MNKQDRTLYKGVNYIPRDLEKYYLEKKAERKRIFNSIREGILAISNVLSMMLIGSIFYMAILYFTTLLITSKASLNIIPVVLINGIIFAIYAVLVYPLLQNFIRYNKKYRKKRK